ncbi:Multiple RNA-binding domain-containing protein 1 [Massospora cicadina]|nr:Multiple RNA-binding domain-containing protein 1 [Massospora cicadina]
MRSRIIVKNLPKHLKEDRLKSHFAKQGHVTDVKLMRASDGTSRKFGYVGFKTDKEAKAAVRFFNGTFIDTSKISVEIAKPIGDPSLPRPWSKYTLEKRKKEEALKARLEKEKADRMAAAKVETLSAAKHLALLKQAAEDPKLKEFLEVMQPRSKAKTWANEDTAMLGKGEPLKDKVKAQVTCVPNKKAGGQGQMLTKTHLIFGDEDDLYEALPSNHEVVEDVPDVPEPQKDEAVVFNPEVSDFDYLKTRMKKDLDEAEPTKAEEPKPVAAAAEETELKPESQIMDNGRLFIRNLPYSCTEADLRKTFEKVGPLSEIHMPISRETKKPKGFAYIMYVLPEHALQAYQKLDNSFFQGRLLHILPAKDKLVSEPDFNDETLGFKKRAELKKKALSTSDYNWNSLFMSTDAIADLIAARLGITKGEVMDPTADNVAARLAMAETQIIMETKRFFEEHGIDLGSFGRRERSDTVIVVKNIPYGTTEGQIREVFEKHGQLGRVLIPPSKTIAVVEFVAPTEARSAFRHLAYKRFGDVPLYLEKAPVGFFEASAESVAPPEAVSAKVNVMDAITEPSNDPTEGTTLFIKNLNFETDEVKLREAFQHLTGLKKVSIKTKPDAKNPGKTLSMGFGFAEFDTKENAAAAMAAMKDFVLQGHSLSIKVSHRGHGGEPVKTPTARTGTKLLVRNVPFEATKNDLRELFGAFGQLKSVRLPKKYDGSFRGFAYLEFVSEREAKNVMANVSSTHLYGRHLVLEYAKDENSIEELRTKVSRQFSKDQPEAKKRRVEFPGEDPQEFSD